MSSSYIVWMFGSTNNEYYNFVYICEYTVIWNLFFNNEILWIQLKFVMTIQFQVQYKSI